MYLTLMETGNHAFLPEVPLHNHLQETNTLVEIKAPYTLDVQNMKDKFKAYKELGYNTKLILNNTETDLYSL